MTFPPAWSAWQLAEFLEAVSRFETEESAAVGAVEHAAEALAAEVAAILSEGRVVASVGYPAGAVPVADLGAVGYGASRELPIPGMGRCPAVRVSLDHPRDAKLVVARSGAAGFGPEELSILRGMARVTSMTMRILRLLDEERAARKELQLLLDEQAALRRVAILVAQGLPQSEIFTAVAEEAGQLAEADLAQVIRYKPDGTAVRVAVWVDRARTPSGTRYSPRGHDLSDMVLQTGQAARVDTPAREAWPAPIHSTIGIPIVVDGRLWGAVIVGTTGLEPMPTDSEQRISGFTELAATAISNAQAREELAASRARAFAATDETRRRIGRNLHDGAQQQLASLALTVRGAIADLPPDAEELRSCLSQVAKELQEVFSQLQEMARGLHPSILSKGGLAPALRMLRNRCVIPVELDVRLDRRLPDSVEIAAYYIVSEGLANVVKHAHASTARVGVRMAHGKLRVDVGDDGVGGADWSRGSGLIGLRDRAAALGGSVTVVSPPGDGTAITAEIPVDAR